MRRLLIALTLLEVACRVDGPSGRPDATLDPPPELVGASYPTCSGNGLPQVVNGHQLPACLTADSAAGNLAVGICDGGVACVLPFGSGATGATGPTGPTGPAPVGATGLLQVVDGGLSELYCDAGMIPVSDGGGGWVCGNAISDAGFGSPPPLGNVAANVVYSTALYSDSGATICFGGDAPVNEDCSAVTLTAIGWTTVRTITPTINNRQDRWAANVFSVDFSGTAGGAGTLAKNQIDCTLAFYAAVEVDGGLYVKQPAGLGAWTSSATLSCLYTDVVLGCPSTGIGDAGCTAYTTNASSNPVATQYQVLVSGSSFLLQEAFLTDAGADAAAYPTYRVGADLDHITRLGTAP